MSDNFQIGEGDRVMNNSWSPHAQDNTYGATSDADAMFAIRMAGNSQTEVDTSPERGELYLFKECSFSDYSIVSRAQSTTDLPTRIKSLRGSAEPRSRRYFDGPQSIKRLRTDQLQNIDRLSSEMALNTPGRVSPRNIRKSKISWSESTESLTPPSRRGDSLEFEDAMEDEDAGLENGNEFPALTDRDVAYVDSWGCRKPGLTTYTPCDTIQEVEGEF